MSFRTSINTRDQDSGDCCVWYVVFGCFVSLCVLVFRILEADNRDMGMEYVGHQDKTHRIDEIRRTRSAQRTIQRNTIGETSCGAPIV